MDYKVGDVIEYRTFSGIRRRLLVQSREADVKNGRPGFDGVCLSEDGAPRWGYDSQIVRVAIRA